MTPLSVLVVEDNADTRYCLQLYIEGAGHRVVVAVDKAAALRHMAKERYDLLLCDIGLTDGTGWELMADAHLHPRTVAVAISGYGTPADLKRSQQAGFARHIIKPFGPDDIENAIQMALENRRKSEAN